MSVFNTRITTNILLLLIFISVLISIYTSALPPLGKNSLKWKISNFGILRKEEQFNNNLTYYECKKGNTASYGVYIKRVKVYRFGFQIDEYYDTGSQIPSNCLCTGSFCPPSGAKIVPAPITN